jgi:hypothetical protein
MTRSRRILLRRWLVVSLGAAMVGVLMTGSVFARGKSGLPPGPGNPIANLNSRLSAIETRFGAGVLWLDHLALLPGDSTVTTAFDANAALGGLVIGSTSTGGAGVNGPKVVATGLLVPLGYDITGVTVCYQLSSTGSFIDSVRLDQLQSPPTGVTAVSNVAVSAPGSVGPACVSSAASSPVDPATGAVRVNLGLTFGATTDTITLLAVGLEVAPSGP